MLRSLRPRWTPRRIHADVSAAAAVRGAELTWYESDFAGVSYAPYETDSAVQGHPLTMLTRMEAGSSFPLHGHPGGEEVLVVEGTFEDGTGAYGAGSYLLNPEGFEHRPFTRQGCVTFVKLRQHGGGGRLQLRRSLDTDGWRAGPAEGVRVKPLYAQDGYPERTWAERWAAGTSAPEAHHDDIREVYVFEGSWHDGTGSYGAGSWLRYAPGTAYRPSSSAGCTLYVKSYPLGTARFIVDPGFRHPDGSLPT